MNTIEFFLKKYLLRKGKILIFWKRNKMKGGNKYELQSGRERDSAKNYIPTLNFNLTHISLIY